MKPDPEDEPRLTQLTNLLEARHVDQTHADADANVVLAPQWFSWKPAFLYGIAHVLHHAKRSRRAPNPTATKWSPSGTHSPLPSVARLVGWADEFYWLSHWRLTGKVTRDPTPASLTSKADLLLLALLQTEWAALIMQAYPHRREVRRGSLAARGFQVWNKGSVRTLEWAFIRRARSRLATAKSAIDLLVERLGAAKNDHCFERCLKHVKRHLYIGQARNWYLAKQEKDKRTLEEYGGNTFDSYLEEAEQCRLNSADSSFIEELRKATQARRDLFTVSAASETSKRKRLDRLHLLANWVLDLFGGDDRDAVHPRASLRNGELPKNADTFEFPNVEAIDKLEKRLEEHRGWLHYAWKQDGLQRRLTAIALAEGRFRERAFPKIGGREKAMKRCPKRLGDWDFFVLRDWASYTPLVPARGSDRARCYGGGYFLWTAKMGVAIDPGYDFIENLYAAQLDIGMITDVIVTHDHYDHVASFGPLLTLLHEYFEEQAARRQPLGRLSFFLSRNVLDHHARLIVGLERYGRIEPLTDCDFRHKHAHRLSDGKTLLLTTHSEHGSPGGFGCGGVGVKFVFGSSVPTLGITSDTGWYPEHSEGRRRARKLHLVEEFAKGDGKHPDVMVLHVGSLKPEELRDSGFYRTHLGARGTFRIVEAMEKCRLAVLSEFGEECSGSRAWFANSLTHFIREADEKRERFRCIPSDRRTRFWTKKGDLWMRPTGRSKPGVSCVNVEVRENAKGRLVFR